jgi:hypothetical protein
MPRKPFKPLQTAKHNMAELARGRVVPTAPVVLGLSAGSPLALLIIDALGELGVQLGPKTSALLGTALSAAIAYFTRAGRRHLT